MKFSTTIFLCTVLSINGFKSQGNTLEFVLHAPKVHPEKDDSYICTSMKIPASQQYIVKYEPNAHKETVHHMLLFGCDQPDSEEKSWDCGDMGAGTCLGSESVLFGWAKDAPPLQLPQGVGFKVGGDSKIKYFVLQLHYVHPLKEGQYDSSGLTIHMTPTIQPNIASIYLLLSNSAEIRPHAKGIHVDIACKYESDQEMHPFAFRTHSHDLGRVITGYRIRNNTWTLLGKGDPHAAQAFYPMKNLITIRKGDILAARCTYDTYNSKKTDVTTIGATADDEMCNFYMMYYRNAQSQTKPPDDLCLDQYTYRNLSRSFPKDSDVALKSSLTSHRHHHHGDMHHSAPQEPGEELSSDAPQQELGTRSSQPPTDDPALSTTADQNDSPVYNPDFKESAQADDVMTDDAVKYVKDSIYDGDVTKGESLQSKPDDVTHGVKTDDVTTVSTGDVSTSTSVSEQTTSTLKSTILPTTSGKGKEGKKRPIDEMSAVADWPSKLVVAKLGQVTGLAVDSAGLVIVFHRGHRKWDIDSFNENNTFHESRGTIREPTILIVDGKSGELLEEWGQDMFYLPHGLTVDHEDNIWITDVGRHQVMKLIRKESLKPSLILGEELVAGSDDKHFCKPTDVAVEKTGVFYVADGYCNGRIMKFSSKGVLLNKWGETSLLSGVDARPSTFTIPHSLTLDVKRDMLYVADRENGRIQCFDTNGTFHKQISSKMFGGRVFAVDYNEQDDVLYAVNGPGTAKVQGFTIQPSTGKILTTWSPLDVGFSQPHAVVSRGSYIYVGEIDPNLMWKLERKHADVSKEDNYVRGIDNNNNDALNAQTSTDKLNNNNHSSGPSNRPAIVILAILGVPAIILLAVGIASKLRGRKKLHKYDMMDEGLGTTNHTTPRDWCVSMNCCRKSYNSMEELYLMDSDSDMEIFPDVHVNK